MTLAFRGQKHRAPG